ncbi:MAG: hypothetical protein NZ602_14175 [Thermoguttaceae bacterium]|nr:hypothetical protein [Thermoguttaceae bacterium]MDW8036976.1 hypothetical protein [Thermoguttaceae bacterium]
MGIGWVLGPLILLGWASVGEGQAISRAQGQAVSSSEDRPPMKMPPSGFWPLGVNELLNPKEANTIPVLPRTPIGKPQETLYSPAEQRALVSQKPSENPLSPQEVFSLDFPAHPSSASKRGSLPPADGHQPGKTDAPNRTALPARPNRLREGTRISQHKGTFTLTGDRVIFSSLAGELPTMVVLENLNLQRVLQNVQTNPQQEIWLVTGRVTEFQGTNYLLLERAIRVDEADLSAPPPPAVNP